ncbi:MAG: DUF89 family protein [Candidatus Methanomethylophilaceae archaeon]|nr:DUF89 family protein [Candidatus Methanomethylophilaceae archaeon]
MMKIQAECIPCLMKRVLFQSKLVDGNVEFDSVSKALKTYAREIDPDRTSVEVATEVHRASYSVIGPDPYRGLKEEADEIAEGYAKICEDMVRGSDDPLRTALGLSVVGNVMDFGSGIAIDDPADFRKVFDDLVEQGLYLDDTDSARGLLTGPGTVVYMFDNCGESQLDRVLIRYIRGTGKRVVGVVRGAPVLNDVTREDAERSGLVNDLDRVLDTGKFYIGIDWSDIPDELRKELSGCDAVIAKGMANFEASSDEKLPFPILHALRAKCVPVAESIGVPVGSSVVKLRMPEVERCGSDKRS